MTGSPAPAGLPSGVAPYKRTPVFTDTSVPKGLLQDHATKAGVWGVIHVEEGALDYMIPGRGSRERLDPTTVGIVRPAELHYVMPAAGCRFFVEFWR